MRVARVLPVVWLALQPAVHAQEATGVAGAKAQQQLDAVLTELSALREQIAAEKLPLARRLGELEARLTELRKESDQVLHEIDAAGFDATKLDSDVQLRQEETGYVTNLLDEYTRNFETKLNVGEVERYGPLVSSAKDAVADRTLTDREKLERQLALVQASITRLDDVVGGSRFEGAAIDPQGGVANGTFALVGPVALFAAKDGSAAGIAVAQTGSTTPAVRPIDEQVTENVHAIVKAGIGLFPLDASRGGALKDLVQRTSIVHVFKKGGPIMWPLLFVSVLALATVMERMLFIARERGRADRKALSSFLAAADQGEFDEAVAIGNRSHYFVVRSLAYALAHREKSLASALMYSNSLEIKRFTRGVPILDTAITIAPLLGLLGTVTGMMSSFSLIGGDLGAPGAITGGIAEALIATAFGLGIAIVSLVPYNYLNNRTEEARHVLEAASAQLELLAKPWLESGPRATKAAAESAA